MHSKLFFSLSLAFLLGLVIVVCSEKGGHEAEDPGAGPPNPVTLGVDPAPPWNAFDGRRTQLTPSGPEVVQPPTG